jgi:hypothetical protein
MDSFFRLYRGIIVMASCCGSAWSQQGTGTIATFRLTPERAIVAADSRTVLHGCSSGVNDNVCKVATFDNKLVFAASGYSGRFKCGSDSAWNVRDITKKFYRQEGVPALDPFVTAWARMMANVLSEDSKISPPVSHGGIILGAVFILVDARGQVKADSVRFSPSSDGDIHVDIGHVIPNGGDNMMGQGAVILEFNAGQTERSKQWHRQIDKLDPDQRVVALAKLTEQFDSSGMVGGPIDSILLTKSGVRWLSVKPDCR